MFLFFRKCIGVLSFHTYSTHVPTYLPTYQPTNVIVTRSYIAVSRIIVLCSEGCPTYIGQLCGYQQCSSTHELRSVPTHNSWVLPHVQSWMYYWGVSHPCTVVQGLVKMAKVQDCRQKQSIFSNHSCRGSGPMLQL